MKKNDQVDRRALFRHGANFLGRLAGEIMDAANETKAMLAEDAAVNLLEPDRGALRPPGALPEADFMQTCTACDDCIKACPEDVLFPAPASMGPIVGTPVFNPARKACFLCADLHCIAACQPKALVQPESIARLAMGKARIDPARCLAHAGQECRYCVDFCPLSGSAIQLLGSTPVIMATECVGCGLCEYYCRQKTGQMAITTLPRLA